MGFVFRFFGATAPGSGTWLQLGVPEPGAHNVITDLAGVRMGHTTLSHGEDTRTGVTGFLPHGGNLFQEKVPAAIYLGNGFVPLL